LGSFGPNLCFLTKPPPAPTSSLEVALPTMNAVWEPRLSRTCLGSQSGEVESQGPGSVLGSSRGLEAVGSVSKSIASSSQASHLILMACVQIGAKALSWRVQFSREKWQQRHPHKPTLEGCPLIPSREAWALSECASELLLAV
jgi:hypothetical protein